jgi:sulfite exporter TauE/SafE
MNPFLAFLTGLTSGGISCLAVQGGLLTATLSSQEKQAQDSDGYSHALLPTGLFLISKLVAHTLLGALLGLFGGMFQLTPSIQSGFMLAAGVYMLGLALHLLNIHPFFRYFVIQPPKWVGKLLRSQSKSHHFFTPIILGILTILIPCGVTQGMEVLAIASGSALTGATLMFSFVLGTSPLFLFIGFITTRLSETFKARFFKIAAVIVLYLSITTINGALVLSGSNFSLDRWLASPPKVQDQPNQEPTITASGTGYTPNHITVKASQPVTLTIITNNNYSCSSIFAIPSLNISQVLPVTGQTQVRFTIPNPGTLTFSCGMGMYSGTITAI